LSPNIYTSSSYHNFSTSTKPNISTKPTKKRSKPRNQVRSRRRRKSPPKRKPKRKPSSESDPLTKEFSNAKNWSQHSKPNPKNRYSTHPRHNRRFRKDILDPIQLYKMERRFTYLLSNYYELLGVSMPRLNSTSDNTPDERTYVYTNPYLSLPYYSSISTPNLASNLLHHSLNYNSYPNKNMSDEASANNTATKHIHSLSSNVPYEAIIQSEVVYEQVQSTIRQIIEGWIYAQEVDMDVHTNANISKKYYGDRNGQRSTSTPTYALQMEYETFNDEDNDEEEDTEIEESSDFNDEEADNSRENNVSGGEISNSLPFNSAVQILRAQYPIRAEIWLDKMEELRYERDQMIQRCLKEQEENRTILIKVGSMVSNVFGEMFSGKKEPTEKISHTLSAHLDPRFTPTTSLYLKLLRAHRGTYRRKLMFKANAPHHDSTTDNTGGSTSISQNSTSLSFLSSKAITKRQENLLKKSKTSQNRGNPNIDPKEHGMVLYEELLKQYAHVGEKAKEADELCHHILEYRQSLYEKYSHDNDLQENHEHKKWFSPIPTKHQMNRDAFLIRLVMKAYAKDSLSNSKNALRTEELLEELKQMETFRDIEKGTLANPEAYIQCFRAYQLAGGNALPDVSARTQRLFHEVSTQVWKNHDKDEYQKNNVMNIRTENEFGDAKKDKVGKETAHDRRRLKKEYFAKKKTEQDLIELYTRVISIYASSKDINYLHKAKSVLQYMEKTYNEPAHKLNIPPTTRCFNTVLKGFIQQREKNTKAVAQMGTSFLSRMALLPNAKPNYESYALLLHLWLLSAPSNTGTQSEMIFSQLETDAILAQHMISSKKQNHVKNYIKENWDGNGQMPEVDTKMYTRLIRNWSLSAARKSPNSAQRAYDLLCRMEVESGSSVGIDPKFGESPFWEKKLRPDARTYENVIGVCAKTQNPNEYDKALEIAFATYGRMMQLNFKPDIVSMFLCISKLVPPAQSRKRSVLAEQILEAGMEHGPVNDAAKVTLKKCSPDIYEKYFGDAE